MATATLSDKIFLIPGISMILGRTLLSIPGSALRGQDGALTVLEHVVNTATRALMDTLNAAQLQLILPPFISSYKSWAKKQNHPIDIVDLPSSTTTQGFWIGNKDAPFTMVYIHGGGFVMPGMPPHLEMLFKFVQWSNNNLGIFCPAYTLAPGGVYPTQLGQCVEALRYVLSLPGRTPGKTLIGGDSAGGNLALAVLSHISGHQHPRSEIVKPLEVSERLFGVLLIAPWTSTDDARFKSMTTFVGRDIVTTSVGHYWMAAYRGVGKEVPFDEFVTAEMARPEWWSDLKAKSVLTVAGEHEILVDAIVSWADKFRKGAGSDVDFKFVIGKSEIHDAPLTGKKESELDGKEEVCQEAAIRAWIKSHLA